MNLRPCIDIHNGKVKQIVGGSLRDAGDRAVENYVSERSAADFAAMFAEDGLPGGHVILLNPPSSPYFEATRAQAVSALRAYPGGLMIGGGITPNNADFYLNAGASHVIVTSYLFEDGRLSLPRLSAMRSAVGREHLVLDLSCRVRDGQYYVVTDRWQTFTDLILTADTLSELSASCAEFLIHGVDAEGLSQGVDPALIALLSRCTEAKVTYAGGISSYADLDAVYAASEGRIDVTIGSALSLYGGPLPYRDVIAYFQKRTV